MAFVWPRSATRGPTRKVDVLLDTTCFSSGALENLLDFDSNSDTNSDVDPHYPFFDLANPPKMTKKNIHNAEDIAVEMSRRKALSDGFINTDARYNHPTFPRPSFLTTLTQPERFKDYIAGKFPEAVNNKLSISLTTGTNHEPLHKEVNATIVNTLLNSTIPTNVANLDWMRNAVFPDNVLPMDFNDHCLNNVQECWDESLQKFSHFPENVTEHAVQDWLNHLAHTMGVKHDLIQKIPEDLTTDVKVTSDAGTGINEGDIDISSDLDKESLDNGVEEEGFVVPKAEDRAFSMVSYRKAPSGGYRPCKPDIVLVNRNLRHFLEEGNH